MKRQLSLLSLTFVMLVGCHEQKPVGKSGELTFQQDSTVTVTAPYADSDMIIMYDSEKKSTKSTFTIVDGRGEIVTCSTTGKWPDSIEIKKCKVMPGVTVEQIVKIAMKDLQQQEQARRQETKKCWDWDNDKPSFREF